MLNKKMQYVIKTCSSENTQELQNLLNEMSMNDWELYSMQEVENDDGQILCHCIFMKEASPSNNEIVEGPPLYWLNVILAESMFPRLIVLEPFPSISE